MKKDKRKIEGITLIALVITIIVLLVLAGVTIASLSGENGILARAAEAKRKTTEANQQENLMLQEIEGIMSDNFDGTSGGNFNDSKKVNAPRLSQGMIPIKFNGTNWVICSENDLEWYDYQNKKWANIMLSDGKYKNKSQVGQVVQDKELGSMFVWIPRYAYSITEYKTAKDGEGTTQNITNVKFLQGRTNSDGTTVYPTDYDQVVSTGQPTPMIVHPAFTFGDSQLPGIWSAKFEASMAEPNENTTITNNKTDKTIKVLPNVMSWRYIQIGNIFDNCLNMNKTNNVYNINASIDSHLMKNNEWGAIAYLATSQYGMTPTRNEDGKKVSEKIVAYTAGGSIEGAYKTNKSQSTNGNETGIYDLNGGTYEYVAAYWDNENEKLSIQGLDKYFKGNKLNSTYSKYWDKYEVSQEEKDQDKKELWIKDSASNGIRKQITDDRYNLMKGKKGDAMYEVIKMGEYSYFGKRTDELYDWIKDLKTANTKYGYTVYNGDFALIGNCSLPFLLRGGSWGVGTNAGVFASNSDSGSAAGFRRFPPSACSFVAL